MSKRSKTPLPNQKKSGGFTEDCMISRKYEEQSAVKFTKGMSREAAETQLFLFEEMSNFDGIKDQDKLTRFRTCVMVPSRNGMWTVGWITPHLRIGEL